MHVLSAPPAFILSQDRTLRSKTRGPCPAPAGCDPALLDFGPPGRSSADQTFGFTRKNDEVLKTQSESTPGLSSGSKQFLASLSSSISSIAVSGFQGSPRGHRRARSYYTPPEGRARPKPRSPRYLRMRCVLGFLPGRMPSVGQRRPALPRADPAVPSALGGLTSGFGMGPGVPPLPWSLTNDGHSAVRAVPWGPHSATSRTTIPSGPT